MSNSFQKIRESLTRELEKAHSRAQADKRRQGDLLLDKQLDFWIESARFSISELEIWDGLGDEIKCHHAVARARDCLHNIHKLLDGS
jgi:hypothetical protein